MRVVMWKLEVDWVRLKVDGRGSKAGGGRLEFDSWQWTLRNVIWELEVEWVRLKVDGWRSTAGGG